MPALLSVVVTLGMLQSVEYRSAAGVEYRSQRDTGAIARAESALAADPRNVDRFIALGVAQSGVRQYREAIETFTRGLKIDSKNALLYRWRGHRYLSTRQFDKAMDDLTRGAKLDSTIYGIWYHLGIVRFVRRDFSAAADAFTRALPMAPDSAERAGATDWLWMSLSRAGRKGDAQALLDRHPDVPNAGNAYAQRLRLYRGETQPDFSIVHVAFNMWCLWSLTQLAERKYTDALATLQKAQGVQNTEQVRQDGYPAARIAAGASGRDAQPGRVTSARVPGIRARKMDAAK